jgi:hypothetical protein
MDTTRLRLVLRIDELITHLQNLRAGGLRAGQAFTARNACACHATRDYGLKFLDG